MALNEASKRVLEGLLVEVVLQTRAEYLRTGSPNILKHWDLIRDRLRAGARTNSTPEDLWAFLRRKLQLRGPTADSSRSFEALRSQVADLGAGREFCALVERRADVVMAMARLEAERRKEEKADGTTTV